MPPNSTSPNTPSSQRDRFVLAGTSGGIRRWRGPLVAVGRVVLVEFWATWCPLYKSTLEWLGELKRKYGDKIAVVALAVESPEDQIRSTASGLSPDLVWAITDASRAQAFGDITAVPTLFLFNRWGKTLRVVFGAPPDLHDQVQKSLDSLVD